MRTKVYWQSNSYSINRSLDDTPHLLTLLATTSFQRRNVITMTTLVMPLLIQAKAAFTELSRFFKVLNEMEDIHIPNFVMGKEDNSV